MMRGKRSGIASLPLETLKLFFSSWLSSFLFFFLFHTPSWQTLQRNPPLLPLQPRRSPLRPRPSYRAVASETCPPCGAAAEECGRGILGCAHARPVGVNFEPSRCSVTGALPPRVSCIPGRIPLFSSGSRTDAVDGHRQRRETEGVADNVPARHQRSCAGPDHRVAGVLGGAQRTPSAADAGPEFGEHRNHAQQLLPGAVGPRGQRVGAVRHQPAAAAAAEQREAPHRPWQDQWSAAAAGRRADRLEPGLRSCSHRTPSCTTFAV